MEEQEASILPADLLLPLLTMPATLSSDASLLRRSPLPPIPPLLLLHLLLLAASLRPTLASPVPASPAVSSGTAANALCDTHVEFHCRRACSPRAAPLGNLETQSPCSAVCADQCLAVAANCFDGGTCDKRVEAGTCTRRQEGCHAAWGAFDPSGCAGKRRTVLQGLFDMCLASCNRASPSCDGGGDGGVGVGSLETCSVVASNKGCLGDCLRGMQEHCGLPTAAEAEERRRHLMREKVPVDKQMGSRLLQTHPDIRRSGRQD